MSRHPCPNVKPQIAAPTGFQETGLAVPSGAGAFRLFAEALFDAGYSPLPVIPSRKKPALRAWSNFCAAPMPRARIQSYAARWPGASLGLALGYAGVIALDVDTEDASQLAAICGAVPPSPVVKPAPRASRPSTGLRQAQSSPRGIIADARKARHCRSAERRHANGAAALAASGRAYLPLADAGYALDRPGPRLPRGAR